MVGNGASRQNKIRGYATEAAFPTTGQVGVWYFDLSTATPYIWNGSAYDDIDPTVDEIWQRVATVISQVNVGDDIAFYDVGSNTVFYMDVSAEELQVGKTTTASVADVKDASAVSQAKLNSVGTGYHVNDFVVGGKTANAKLTVVGDVSRKMTDAGAAHYNPSILTTDYKITANNTAAPRNIIISTEDVARGTPTQPREFLVSDYYGQAGANALTVSGESGTINGVANIVLSVAYSSLTIHSDGTNLTVV